jgi:hypothetical protein
MADIELLKKLDTYDTSVCYQYQRRLDTIEEDKQKYGWTDEDLKEISIDDFVFENITSNEDKKECKEFIERYEWLGCLGWYSTHYFTARYVGNKKPHNVDNRGLLGGVIVMGMPNAFSKLLGEETKNLERLVNRGASASWTPKNLGTKFLSWCCKWMVQNTQYRLFTAYSDPSAGELGTIYMASNWYLVSKSGGASTMCINPYDKSKIISDRRFRARSFYRRYADELGIESGENWKNDTRMLWENIPDDIEKKLRDYAKKKYEESEKIKVPAKMKWAFVLGKDKRETKNLRKKLLELNKIYEHPTERGK